MRYTVRLLANARQDLADIETYSHEHVPHETERCLNAIETALDWILGERLVRMCVRTS